MHISDVYASAAADVRALAAPDESARADLAALADIIERRGHSTLARGMAADDVCVTLGSIVTDIETLFASGRYGGERAAPRIDPRAAPAILAA